MLEVCLLLRFCPRTISVAPDLVHQNLHYASFIVDYRELRGKQKVHDSLEHFSARLPNKAYQNFLFRFIALVGMHVVVAIAFHWYV
jgi:hypothetical protein